MWWLVCWASYERLTPASPRTRLSWDTIPCGLSSQASSWPIDLGKHFKRLKEEAAKHLKVKALVTSPLGSWSAQNTGTTLFGSVEVRGVSGRDQHLN